MRKLALALCVLALSPSSRADSMSTSDETLTTARVCDLPTNLPPDPGLDADATLDKVQLPTLYADLYGSTRSLRQGDVEVYAGSIAIDPNTGEVLGPDFLPRVVHPFDPLPPEEPGQILAQSPAIRCE